MSRIANNRFPDNYPQLNGILDGAITPNVMITKELTELQRMWDIKDLIITEAIAALELLSQGQGFSDEFAIGVLASIGNIVKTGRPLTSDEIISFVNKFKEMKNAKHRKN